MDILAQRVAAQFALRMADEGEEESGKGGVPPRWQEWLDAVHQGGRVKVPNPNAETRDRYHEVAFSTALKDKQVFGKALKDYHEWIKKNPEKGRPTEKPAPKPEGPKAPEAKKEEPKSEKGEAKPNTAPKGKLNLKGPLKVSDADLDKIITKHKADFEKLTKEMKGAVAAYEKNYDKMTTVLGDDLPEYASKEFKSLPEPEKMLHVAGHKIGALFEKTLSKDDKELQETLVLNWQNSSSNSTSTQVQGALGTLGVLGHQTAKDKEKKMYRDAGMKKEAWKGYMGKVYAFTQAYYRHLGLKEVTLYRGVVSKALDKTDVGDEVNMQTRELSSFSSDPKIAAQFGHPVKVKVPVENILWSNLTAPMLTEKEPPGRGEGEISVMGASDLPGTIIGRAVERMNEMEGR